MSGTPLRRLCFGGTFNPIHHAHLICSRAVAEAAGYDQVVLIPARQPPHKPETAHIAPAEHRLAMCQLAMRGSPLFTVDDVELRRDAPSYTIETARELKRTRGWPEVHWLIGADMVRILPQWHEADALLREVHLVLMARPGWTFDWSTLPAAFRPLQQRVITTPQIELGATELRARVAAGLSIEYFTPPAVVDYIQTYRLYRPTPPVPSPGTPKEG